MWLHGKPQSTAAAGLFFPIEQIPEMKSPDFMKGSFVSAESNKEVFGFASKKAYLAIIRVVTTWGKSENGSPNSTTSILCRIRGESGLFEIGVDGASKGKPFCELINRHILQIMGVVNGSKPANANDFEQFACWCVVEIGEPVKITGRNGGSSNVTMPQLSVPKEVTLEYCRELFVGNNIYLQCVQDYKATARWEADKLKKQTQETVENSATGDQVRELFELANRTGDLEVDICETESDGAHKRFEDLTFIQASNAITTLKAALGG
jgi:hypothetical protein